MSDYVLVYQKYCEVSEHAHTQKKKKEKKKDLQSVNFACPLSAFKEERKKERKKKSKVKKICQYMP